MPLTPAEEARRRTLEGQNRTGRDCPELDQLNRAKTDGMSDAELFARVNSGKPSEQAKAALRRRGHYVE